jgi:rhodanese-related sulfurtransferase
VVGLGYVFAKQIDDVLMLMANAGVAAVEVLGALLAAYMLVKWWQRRRLLLSLRLARITVDELHQMIEDGQTPVVVDVRSQASRVIDNRIIPGALRVDLRGIDRDLDDVPIDQDVIIYCSCPNEVSAATAAKGLMMRGYRRVRPLLGGLDAWADAGYDIERLIVSQDVVLIDAQAAPGHVH